MQLILFFFFFNDTATTEIYTLSLHDALPISLRCAYEAGSGAAGDLTNPASRCQAAPRPGQRTVLCRFIRSRGVIGRSEEHTSELQSRQYLVCRLLLEKKKKQRHTFSRNHHNT